MRTLITNARILLRDRVLHGYVLCEQGLIAAVEAGAPGSIEGCTVVDAQGAYLSPGFVDLHTHGAGGSDFMDATVADIHRACITHLRQGTTCLLPTTLACPEPALHAFLEVFRRARESLGLHGPELPGVHLEGPYLNPKQRGAMQAAFLRLPDPQEYLPLLAQHGDLIASMTAAPELEGAMAMADAFTKRGILLSMGHSQACYDQVLRAYDHGFTHVTHLYSAMSSIVRVGGFRRSGLLESAFAIEPLTVELIADGCHVPHELLRMTWRIKGSDRVCLVSDAMRCAGVATQTAWLGSREDGYEVLIEDGVAKQMDRSAFAGSIATADRLVRVMHCDVGIPLTDCITMMSTTPARLIGMGRRKGSIAVGKDADLVLFDDSIRVLRVFRMGQEAVFA